MENEFTVKIKIWDSWVSNEDALDYLNFLYEIEEVGKLWLIRKKI
jgi:hypothetical protein